MIITSIPKVSIIVPSFNEQPNIIRNSISSIFAQTFRDFECIVIDESTDIELATAIKILCDSDKRFKYIHPEKRLGLAASLNLGISMSNAPLIARFDSDDICMPYRLERQVNYINDNPGIDVLGGGLEIIDKMENTIGYRLYPLDHDSIVRKLHITTSIAHPTVIIRKSVIDKYGGYDSDFRYSEDLDLWLRYSNQGVKFSNLSEVLVRYRQEQTNRNPLHWKYNLLARKKNFSLRQLPYRFMGLCGIYVWSKLSPKLQQYIYGNLLLHRNVSANIFL